MSVNFNSSKHLNLAPSQKDSMPKMIKPENSIFQRFLVNSNKESNLNTLSRNYCDQKLNKGSAKISEIDPIFKACMNEQFGFFSAIYDAP
ncbi:MAG: hypothetical protein H0T62_09290 [Parachlamydiaceae bacterium]|nr:hypothetical protein [Parachlamydiaceae bacterium]